MLKRECRAKLEIATIFEDTYLRFIPVLAKEDFEEDSDLAFEIEEEFNVFTLYPIQAEIREIIQACKK